MKYVVNLKIMTGVYEGYCIQLLLTFSDNYPIHPPKLLIYPGQSFDNIYHHHIFRSELKDEKDRYFNKFCYDLLENDFLSTSSEEHTGWNPSYTISTLLLQIQTFLSKPDFPTGYIPPKEKIDELMKSMDNYEKSFIIKNDNNEDITRIHTWKNPYPEMFFVKDKQSNKIKEENVSVIPKEIKEDLTCFISRLNYIDDKNILLGYPIKRIRNGNLIPIPEILSYEGFIEELSKNDVNDEMDSDFDDLISENINMDNYQDFFFNRLDVLENNTNNVIDVNDIHEGINLFNMQEDIIMFRRDFFPFFFHGYSRNSGYFKSANNEFYNSWLPIFINEEHFEKNKTTILNYFSILKYGNSGIKKYDFHPQYIFEIMPNILSSMIKKMSKNKISSSFLKCFFQNVLMFKNLEKKYNDIFIKYQKFYLHRNINKILTRNEIFDLKKEFLELLVLFYFSDNKVGRNIKEQLNNYILKLKNVVCLKLFEKENFNFENQESFINDLKKNKLFDQIVDIIFLNSHYLLLFNKQSLLNISEIIRKRIIKQMNTNFKGLYNNLNNEIKQKIQKILLNELNFSRYFNLNFIHSFLYNKGFFIKSIFDSLSQSSEFISIFDFLRQKVLDKNFLNELDKNFGHFMNNDSFIEELNKKRKNKENFDSNFKTFFGGKNLNSIKNLFRLSYFYVLCEKNNWNYIRNEYNKYEKFVEFPFMKSNYHDECLFLTLSEIEKYIYEKERDLGSLKYKMMFYKKEILKDKILKKRKRERINIKRSYNKNYNKAIGPFNNKKCR